MRRDALNTPVPVGTYNGDPTVVSLSVSSSSPVLLVNNKTYRLWSSVDAFFTFGGSGVTATTSSNPLKAGLDVLHLVREPNLSVAAIVATGTGSLFISEYDVYSA